jgi:acyl dehydratase
MAYAAGLGDPNPAYFDTESDAGVIGHPLFPVCVEWPVVLAARDELTTGAVTTDELRRGVHASHDLIIHRLVVPGDELTTTATIEAVEPRPPGAYEVLRLETVDQSGAPVATTRMGSIFRGVAVEGEPAGELVPPPPSGRVTGARLATTPLPIGEHLAHVYTETARIYNPIHTDAAVAHKAGLAEPILHGTATLAMAISEVVAVAGGGDPRRVARVSARFGAMVTMPSTITVRVHSSTPRQDGWQVVSFAVANERGDAAVDHGVVVLAP